MPPLLGPAILGAIGTAGARYYQKKAFDHEAESAKRAVEVQHATEVFERLSTAMDQRLYAMRRVNWALSLDYLKGEADARWQAYDEVLIAWNSNLSKNLAMNERYFGEDMRADLATIQQSFKDLHDHLVDYYHKNQAPEDFEVDLDATNEKIHLMNSEMIRRIQAGNVGIFQADGELRLTAVEKRRKDHRALQQDLNQILKQELKEELEVDGIYGRKTRAAVILFQQQHDDLEVDGKAGPKTRAKIREVLESAESEA